MKHAELLLFAEQPRAGTALPRLVPTYTSQEAVRVAELLLRQTVELACGSWPDEVELHAAPDAGRPLFAELAEAHGLAVADQIAGDRGARMYAALRGALERFDAAAILDCRVPHCPWDTLDDANLMLVRGRNVLGPTEDGDYYFLGVQRAWPELFEDIPWGRGGVLEATLARAAALGIEFEMLPALRTVETPADLWLVAQVCEPLKAFVR
jgi:hypothetical protein